MAEKMEDPKPYILLVEDDPDTAELIRETLADHFTVDRLTHVDTIAKARALDLTRFDLVLSDVNLPDGSGIDLLEYLHEQHEDLPTVMVTSESAMDTAMQAIHRGAYDYIVKTGDYLFSIPLMVQKNMAVWQMKRENVRLEDELHQTLEQLRIKNAQLEEVVTKLAEQASTDPLTGMANRRHIQDMLQHTFAESSRYGTDLACLMIDLDGFKQINDTCGHQTGDRLLQAAGRALAANCRACDIAGRYGGDEFLVLLPHTDPKTAMNVARRIQRQFLDSVPEQLPEQAACSLSIGIASASQSRPASAEQLVALADAAMYQAKQSGKAQIAAYEAPADPTPPKLAGQPTH